MKKCVFYLLTILLAGCSKSVPYSDETIKNDLRAPAYPLLMLHPHVRLWSATDNLTGKNMTFTNGKAFPFVGFLRVDGVMYRFMGSRELPMQAIAPMAYDREKWEGKYTSLIPNEGWEQPDFDDQYWQVGEGAFGTRDKKETKTQWLSSDIWVRREVAEIDPYLLEHHKVYLRYSHDDRFQLYINGKQLVSTEDGKGTNLKVEVPDSILATMKGGKALIAAHCENKKGGALVDFGLFAEKSEILAESVAPVAGEKEWIGKYTVAEPPKGWEMAAFNDSTWTQGCGAFGTEKGENVYTPWGTKRLWIRREVTFDPAVLENRQLFARYSHNDGMQLFINGKELVHTGTKARSDVKIQIPDSILETMKDGKALLAARCVNWGGTAFADFGLYGELKEAEQKSVDVQATQTHYRFECGNVELKLSFTAPCLPADLEQFARPVNYISYQVQASDGKKHDVEIYFEMDPHKAFGAGQSTEMYEKNGVVLMKTGTENQKLWVDKGKDAPAWGYFYIGAKDAGTTYAQGDAAEMRAHFMKRGELKGLRRTNEECYAAIAQKLEVDSEQPEHLTVAFDGLRTMAYFGEDLHPYWNREGKKTVEELYEEAEKAYSETMAKCYAFDRELMSDAYRVGGKEYAELCALSYRQVCSSFQMSETPDGELLYFTTLVGPGDLYFAASPLFLTYHPELLKAMLNPFFYYSESGKWKKPYPAHNLGGYPFVNGQTKGADLPVEEAGNMLIMTAAIAKVEKNASYAEKHWEVLSKWAGYLSETGVDTGKQVGADDIVARYPHNANLSAKGILGIASYALLAETSGKREEAEKYMAVAQKLVQEWETLALEDDHYRLAFNQEDSWGMKYNLVWDKLLGLNVFPDSVIEKETAFYATKLSDYGCPLNSTTNYTRADWNIWIAALNSERQAFRKFILPVHSYMNTSGRSPMPDTYDVQNRKTITKYWGRPTAGGFFIRMLEEKMR